ncbi:MAG: hypothetical protein K2P49_00840 [Oscillospiraceae bacterium]|nr:hypothetical protein [Oscillospiraceae bacterium]
MVTDSALSLLGLALRGNNLAVGEAPVEEACKTRRAWLVVSAADAAQNSVDRAGRWAEAGGVPWIRVPWDKEVLGGALGRSVCAMAALTDRGLATALAEKLAGRDENLRPIASLLNEKKNGRAQRPAVPEI